ncbi:MAG: imidazoleglycerol-phosphate dehydratase HisB [Oscillospiraceae bacterium]|jgi:imidazoleglycerol-phosphate dehydratase|nr:imidazoleglycerol-phosphate dehydratase HisB [Oscillospiraceae bacterium]
MREGKVIRNTKETQIELDLSLDGGEISISTPCGFLNHMLELLAWHGRFGLRVKAGGDTEVDYHHLTEDLGICLGKALSEALGEKSGIIRFGECVLPMDEALVLCAVDISGRAHLEYALNPPTEKTGDFDTSLVKEFFLAMVRAAGVTVHLRQLSGENSHHILEAGFKAFARALRAATRIDEDFAGAPSTKGVL